MKWKQQARQGFNILRRLVPIKKHALVFSHAGLSFLMNALWNRLIGTSYLYDRRLRLSWQQLWGSTDLHLQMMISKRVLVTELIDAPKKEKHAVGTAYECVLLWRLDHYNVHRSFFINRRLEQSDSFRCILMLFALWVCT